MNPKLQSIYVEKFPIEVAHFTRDGTEVVMISNKKSFIVYDMMAGKISRTKIRGRGKDGRSKGEVIFMQSLFLPGHDERYFESFVVSPDNELLVFLGKDGYMPLVSNKVCT